MRIGDTVTLKDDADFRAIVLAISGWGQVYLQVHEWSFQTGGYRDKRGVLCQTRYPISRLEIEEEK